MLWAVGGVGGTSRAHFRAGPTPVRVEGEGWNQTGQNQTQQEIIECILNRLHEKKPNLIMFFFTRFFSLLIYYSTAAAAAATGYNSRIWRLLRFGLLPFRLH